MSRIHVVAWDRWSGEERFRGPIRVLQHLDSHRVVISGFKCTADECPEGRFTATSFMDGPMLGAHRSMSIIYRHIYARRVTG